ncbi:hypothetical protein BDY17DRAFT_30364 [Neohortaea acidophila]|uniref:Uncharacterized protein n=1 Tax=Neohortaea acidophila TaxID=245834 RepID=A0A6A6PJ13_9PEZI|nr:uncharacterized protein BDY17DRAFT_30364 [Neohortaea acidophila]KAF2480030.1 hypothetical protein BDY17DRAFT_30364 [Neohortaea acidophila]
MQATSPKRHESIVSPLPARVVVGVLLADVARVAGVGDGQVLGQQTQHVGQAHADDFDFLDALARLADEVVEVARALREVVGGELAHAGVGRVPVVGLWRGGEGGGESEEGEEEMQERGEEGAWTGHWRESEGCGVGLREWWTCCVVAPQVSVGVERSRVS